MKKRILSLLIASALMLGLAACGGSGSGSADNEANSSPEVSTPAESSTPSAESTAPEASVEPSEEPSTEPSEEPSVEPSAEPSTAPSAPAESKPVESTPVQSAPVETTPAESAPVESVPVESAPVETTPVETPAPSASVDLTAFYNDLAAQYGENFPATMSLTEMPEYLDAFFPGLSAIPTKQLLAYQPMMGAVVCEIVLVEVENASDMDAVKAILQDRIDVQAGGGAWYPESVEGWLNNSRIVSNGNYVMMIAYSFCDDVVASFNALFN